MADTVGPAENAVALRQSPGASPVPASAPRKPVARTVGQQSAGTSDARPPGQRPPQQTTRHRADGAAGEGASETWSRAGTARPLDYEKLRKAIREKYARGSFSDPIDEFEWLRERTASGDPEAALTLGLLLAYGHGIQTDPALAAHYFEQAANAGIARGRTELGRLLLLGSGLPPDTVRAARLFREAWGEGDAEGAFLLASAHRHQLIPGADPEEARRWLAVAADHGHLAAQKAAFLLRDEVPAGTEEQLLAWLYQAADSGDTDALTELGGLLRRSGEVEHARTMLEAAAERGSLSALRELVLLAEPNFWRPERARQLSSLFAAHIVDGEAAPNEAYHFVALFEALADPEGCDLVRIREMLEAAKTRGYFPAAVALTRLDRGEHVVRAIYDAFREGENAAYVAEANQRLGDPQSVTRGRTLVRARPIEVVTPVYPAELHAERVAGRAVVRVLVGTDGRAHDLELIDSTHPAFGAAAIEAVRQWRFAPATLDGKAVNLRNVVVPIRFMPPD